MDTMGVCSSVAVDGLPHSTSPHAIANFLAQMPPLVPSAQHTTAAAAAAFSATAPISAVPCGVRVLFCTYRSLPRVVRRGGALASAGV